MNLSFQKTKKWPKRWLPTPWKHHYQPCVDSHGTWTYLILQGLWTSLNRVLVVHLLLFLAGKCFKSHRIHVTYNLYTYIFYYKSTIFIYLKKIPYMHSYGSCLLCHRFPTQRILHHPAWISSPLNARSWRTIAPMRRLRPVAAGVQREGVVSQIPPGSLWVEGGGPCFEPKKMWKKSSFEMWTSHGFSCDWWREDS